MFSSAASFYYAVAVVRKGSGVTWKSLKGKKSCHTGLIFIVKYIPSYIPINILTSFLVSSYLLSDVCFGFLNDFCLCCPSTAKYFSQSCAPGADPKSKLCALCAGSGKGVGSEDTKCKPSAEELYYGYAGAFRYDFYQKITPLNVI